MELGMGKLGWAPTTFWKATLIEISAAAHGLAKLHGVEDETGSVIDAPLSMGEFEELKEKLGA